jgi:hypothetical protein
MRALNSEFELFDGTRAPSLMWERECRRVRNCPVGDNRRRGRKYKNSGNEAKKYLKTKDITFLSAANYAYFAR